MAECLMFGIDMEARCMDAVVADEETVAFLIGTQTIKTENQVNKLYVGNEGARILSRSFRHPAGEVRALASSPSNPTVLATCAADFTGVEPKYGLYVWNMDDDKRTLGQIGNEDFDQYLHGLVWDSTTNRTAVVGTSIVRIFDMTPGPQALQTVPVDGEVFEATWSPHNSGNLLGVSVGKDVVCIDTRSAKDDLKVASAHSHRTLSIDFNPNLQHMLASAGDDGFVRIWDMREPSQPFFSFHPHAHWIWQIRYHPVHDQLLLSVGSDACVVLSCAQTVSSEVDDLTPDEDEFSERLEDGELERIDEHEESVYACAWSVADPWTFASLSFDGRVIFSKVSRKHKYALMQL
ncbi:unnamed protein product [Caenorhabditis auriculariae]|uniref:EIPR1-like beta-propeller domain-containing protein n=1 Tax=Caenorhabditis auriculariae TaxID=2777116 RepID=A0A8S1HPC0_9PELO|nr:unnamed protein product [Caenorhabditis auriculariae]